MIWMFWILALLMVAAALFFIIPALMMVFNTQEGLDRKKVNVVLFKDQLIELDNDLANGVLNQEQYQTAKEDLERSLLQDISDEEYSKAEAKHDSQLRDKKLGQIAAVVAALFVPILSIVLYNHLGAGESGLDPAHASPQIQAQGHEGSIEEQVRKLQEYVLEHPEDLDKQIMLARTYYMMKQYQPASGAFAKAVALSDNKDPNLLADYADSLAMANNQSMEGKPMEVIQQALQLNPTHVKALWLAATYYYQKKEYAKSLEYYQTLKDQFPKGSENYYGMLRNIGEVKQLMGMNIDAEVAELKAAESAKADLKVAGRVSIDPALKGQYSPSDTLFIYARAASGPKMPLAIIRTTAADLPMDFSLDDSMAMNPQMKLSSMSEVIVGARISKSGTAMPQPGDLQGLTSVVKVGSTGLNIQINEKVSGNAGGGSRPPMAMANAGTSAPAAGGDAVIVGTVSLDPSLQSRVSPEDSLFIFARASSGPRMPLAVIRKQVKDLPISFTLDDSKSMSPQFTLSKFSDVIVGARISKTGDAIAQTGDLQGLSSIIKVGTKDLRLIINSAVP